MYPTPYNSVNYNYRAFPEVSNQSTISLRILATTDLHMNIGTGNQLNGLAHLAPLIADERNKNHNVMLFDNGDLLEGTPLADDIARTGLRPHEIHPAIAALNMLEYDAATLGNHDFANGMAFLHRTLRDAQYPVVLANAGRIEGAPLWTESTMLRRRMRDEHGHEYDITVGVFGVMPPQTTKWEPRLAHEIVTEDVVIASHRAVSSLRARGADLIIALSHGGYENDPAYRPENSAGIIASIPGVNAVIAGHTHKTRVYSATPDRAVIVKSGYNGSHLAAVSLCLHGHPGGWKIECTAVETIPAGKTACSDLLTLATPSADAEHRLNAPLGKVSRTLHSHYALLGSDPSLRLTESAIRAHIAEFQSDLSLPVLVAFAPFRTGGRAGPEHFINIPQGPIRRKDISALYPFTNHIVAVEVTAAEIIEWLERAASLFHHLSRTPSQKPLQALINSDIPGFQSDFIAGLDYEIDLATPPAFDASGRSCSATGRVRNIRYREKPITTGDRFLVVTNSYRMTNGPLFSKIMNNKKCLLPEIARIRVSDIIARHIGSSVSCGPLSESFFKLSAPQGTAFWFDTAPEADLSVCPLPVLDAEVMPSGFQRLTIQL